MVTVYLPASLVALFPGAPRHLAVEGATVAQVVAVLQQGWPGMRDRLCEAGPVIRQHINIFVNGEKAELHTPVPPGAIVRIIPALSGG